MIQHFLQFPGALKIEIWREVIGWQAAIVNRGKAHGGRDDEFVRNRLIPALWP
jgi:hypothetical protein